MIIGFMVFLTFYHGYRWIWCGSLQGPFLFHQSVFAPGYGVTAGQCNDIGEHHRHRALQWSFMYEFMMRAAVEEPSTTYAILSALMQPAVPYYIIINSLLELFIMLLVVFFNWDVDRRRRTFSLIGVGLYLVMRIWTYLVYAETRLDISTQTLSAADVEWFKRTLATDFRPILELIAQGFFILAALVPVRLMRDGERARERNLG
jgi:hypothetical protein